MGYYGGGLKGGLRGKWKPPSLILPPGEKDRRLWIRSRKWRENSFGFWW